MVLLTQFKEKLERREEIVALLEKLEREKNCIEQEIKVQMGEAERAECEKYHIQWSNVR